MPPDVWHANGYLTPPGELAPNCCIASLTYKMRIMKNLLFLLSLTLLATLVSFHLNGQVKVSTELLYPQFLTNVNGTLFFRAYDAAHGLELWKSDGTEAGTVLVKDIVPGTDHSSPYELTDVNGTLFFLAYDAAHGHELWKSDGTEAGTVLVKDIVPGTASSYPYSLTDVNGTLFFIANDGTGNSHLWKYVPCSDADGDGICDEEDNCPTTPNADQANSDGDNLGDACDACPNDPDNDMDNDGLCANEDNCPMVPNVNQEDLDQDEIGDACDNSTNAEAALGTAKAYIAGLNLSAGLKHALYDSKLKKAVDFYCEGKVTEALEKLAAFIDQLYDLWADGKISTEEYETLTYMANIFINAINEGELECPVGFRGQSNRITMGEGTQLGQNYPNPLTEETVIPFVIADEGYVTLKIVDAQGMTISTPVDELLPAGFYNINLNTKDLSAGVYFYSLQLGQHRVDTRRMSIIK